MIPFIIKTSPKSNYFFIDYTKDGKSIRSMFHKPIYTCEESKAMQNYHNNIANWLKSFI